MKKHRDIEARPGPNASWSTLRQGRVGNYRRVLPAAGYGANYSFDRSALFHLEQISASAYSQIAKRGVVEPLRLPTGRGMPVQLSVDGLDRSQRLARWLGTPLPAPPSRTYTDSCGEPPGVPQTQQWVDEPAPPEQEPPPWHPLAPPVYTEGFHYIEGGCAQEVGFPESESEIESDVECIKLVSGDAPPPSSCLRVNGIRGSSRHLTKPMAHPQFASHGGSCHATRSLWRGSTWTSLTVGS